MFRFFSRLLGETVARPKTARLELTFMEGRTTPAVLGSGNLVDLRHGEAEVRGRENEARHGADDPANHNVGDDRGGMRAETRNLLGRGGADDPANHDIGDDRGGGRGGRRHDDAPGHR